MWKLSTPKYLITLVLCLAFGGGIASAQTVGSQAGGSDLLNKGEGALAKGKFKAAAQTFSKAMRAGDLSNVQVARALYQRGIAYEKSGRPAQAIADITNALYIEGLPGGDRAKALLSRGRAYDAVGMKDLARSDLSRARSGGASERRIAGSERSAPSRTGGASFSTRVQSPGSHAPAPAFRTQAKARLSPPKQQKVASFETQTRAPKSQIPRFRTTIFPQETRAPAPKKNRRVAAAPPAVKPSGWDTSTAGQGSPSPPQETEKPKGRVRQFIGGLWGRDKSGGEETQTAAAPAPASPQWSQTSTATRPAPAAPRAPRPAVTGASPQAVPVSGSGYRIQLAALRSDADARATWKRLASKHQNLLAGRQPNIVRTDLGGLGTFYRVQLGPYADKGSSQKLCEDFKRGGLDCFLLAP